MGGNLVRMLTIVIAGEVGGQTAGNVVHESTLLSILPYIPAIFGLLLLGRLLEEKRGEAPNREVSDRKYGPQRQASVIIEAEKVQV